MLNGQMAAVSQVTSTVTVTVVVVVMGTMGVARVVTVGVIAQQLHTEEYSDVPAHTLVA